MKRIHYKTTHKELQWNCDQFARALAVLLSYQ